MRPDESFIGNSVRSLQTMLRVIGADAGRQLTVVPDGIYGQQTQAEVSRFQQERGIPVTGVADQRTWERIVAEYHPALTRVGPAEPVRIILNPGASLGRGSNSHYVLMIQAMLHTLSQVYQSISPPALTGIYDEATVDAVSLFQNLSGLPQTGELDKLTWKHLALHYPMAVNLRESQNIVITP